MYVGLLDPASVRCSVVESRRHLSKENQYESDHLKQSDIETHPLEDKEQFPPISGLQSGSHWSRIDAATRPFGNAPQQVTLRAYRNTRISETCLWAYGHVSNVRFLVHCAHCMMSHNCPKLTDAPRQVSPNNEKEKKKTLTCFLSLVSS